MINLANTDLHQFKHVYFLGIGGIGMSALARWFKQHEFWVGGYDKTPSPLTESLINEGIEIHFEDSVQQIPAFVKENKEQTLVVLTPAIPKNHAEWAFFKDAQYEILKRSQVLGLISRSCFTVGVAGTHGKTTTSSMIAYLLKEAGLGCTAFLGGVTSNYGTNFLLSDKLIGDTVMVVEADEFDRSFLTLFPNIAVVTSTDSDHLDIYGDDETMKQAYGDFIGQIKREGKLFVQNNIKQKFETRTGVVAKTYGLSDGQLLADNVAANGFGFDFELKEGLANYGKFHLSMPGFHNVENAIAAIAVANALGISYDKLREILPGFKGVKRRFEKVYEDSSVVLVDDYAHHPTEISAALKSMRALFPEKKLGVIFQPHLFSRTKDFALEFSHSLNEADRLWLLDIYPARELPMSGVTSKLILDRIDISEKAIVSKEELVEQVVNSDCQVIVVLGAGDIDRMVQPLANALSERSKTVEA
jgi:UDP-N-acetylmuramate--alanine ligase